MALPELFFFPMGGWIASEQVRKKGRRGGGEAAAAGDQVALASACPASQPADMLGSCPTRVYATSTQMLYMPLLPIASAQVPWSSYPDNPAATSKHRRNSLTTGLNCRAQGRRRSPYPEGLKLGS